jgi:hypothetical protein
MIVNIEIVLNLSTQEKSIELTIVNLDFILGVEELHLAPLVRHVHFFLCFLSEKLYSPQLGC